ncbi:unnamed protein product, partial [Effrenium voratum]
ALGLKETRARVALMALQTWEKYPELAEKLRLAEAVEGAPKRSSPMKMARRSLKAHTSAEDWLFGQQAAGDIREEPVLEGVQA